MPNCQFIKLNPFEVGLNFFKIIMHTLIVGFVILITKPSIDGLNFIFTENYEII